MSRRCPKCNHLFLNWLNGNRALFLIEPRITKIYKKTMTGFFAGATSTIKFYVYRGSHIEVNVFLNDQSLLNPLAVFLFWEKLWKGGYYSEWLDPDLNNYYSTREELWLTECFAPFLDWCNESLATNRWLAIYEDETIRIRLQDSKTPIENLKLFKLINVSKEAGG